MFLLFLGIIIGSISFLITSSIFNYRRGRKFYGSVSFDVREAEALLKVNGYKIINRNLAGEIETTVDGAVRHSPVLGQFLVEKEGKNFIVHSVPSKADPQSVDLRFKFLEIYLMFKPDGILLLDLSDKSIHEIYLNIKKSADFLEKLIQIVVYIFIVLIIFAVIWLLRYLRLF